LHTTLLITALIAAVLLLIGGIAIAIIWREVHRWRRATFGRLAAKYDGVVTGGALTAIPAMQFPFRGSTALLDFAYVGQHGAANRSGMYFAQIHLPWPDAALRCELAPRGHRPDFAALSRLTVVETGDADFDKHYLLLTSSPARVREMFTPAARSAIQNARVELRHKAGLHLAVRSGEMEIQRSARALTATLLDEFIQSAATLYDELTRSYPQPLALPRLPHYLNDTALPFCRLCGQEIEGVVSACNSCQAPHHRKCWDAMHHCASYGCNSHTRLAIDNESAAALS